MAQKFSSCFAFKILALLARNTLSSTAWLVIAATLVHIPLHYTVSKIEQHILYAQSLTSLLSTHLFYEFQFSSENVTSRFCNHFFIIQSHYACKMCSNYPGIKLELALHR